MNIERPQPRIAFPPDAQRVFKGEIFDIYQWKQKLYDGTEVIFEAAKRPDTVDVIPITPEGKIVILHEEQPTKAPYITFPGGRVEAGEDVARAGKRELLEETGYQAGPLTFWFAVQPVSKIDWCVFFLVAKQCVKTSEQKLDSGEKIDVEEIDFETFIQWASTGTIFGEEITARVLQARLDPSKMAELKILFSPS